MFSDLRRHPRYFLPNGLQAQLEQTDASVVDLSVKGARVQITKPLAVGSKIGFSVSANGNIITGNATVLWCQMAALALDDDESDVYLAGVVFENEIPALECIIDRLIARDEAIAIVDARSTERYSITIPLHGSFGEHNADIRITDLSIRGGRIVSIAPLRIGTATSLRFRLEPGPAVDVSARVVWCRPSDRRHGYEVGLDIHGEEALLRAVIAQMCMRKQARVDLNSLRRKFDPLRSKQKSGMLALAS